MHHNRGTVGNRVFYGGPYQGVNRRTTGARIDAAGRELPFRKDLSTEAEDQPLLEPLPGNY
jgi:hypothetical protein